MGTTPLKRVLHVEDEPDIRFLVEIALRSIGGMSIKSCESMGEARKALTKFEAQLLLLDARLSDADGLEMMEALRSIPTFEKAPVVFITGLGGRDSQRLRDAGALEVITKPFDTLTLAQCLHRIWNTFQGSVIVPGHVPPGPLASSAFGRG